MTKGDNVLITYKTQGCKTVLATFLEKDNAYFFKDIHGIFAISEKAIDSKEIILEVIED